MAELQFHNLSDRHYGLTKATADGLTEAACVCLDRHHTSSVNFQLTDNQVQSEVTVSWEKASPRTQGAWNNAIDATESGACALALAAIDHSRGLVAIKRAETLTGADYYIDKDDRSTDDLENALRLEVSGTDRGNESDVKGRLKAKISQAAAGRSSLPAVACVVGFSTLKIMLADVGTS